MKQNCLFIVLLCSLLVKAEHLPNCNFNPSDPIITHQGQSLLLGCYLGEKFQSCELAKTDYESDQQCLYIKRAGAKSPLCPQRIQFVADASYCNLNLKNITMKGKFILSCAVCHI